MKLFNVPNRMIKYQNMFRVFKLNSNILEEGSYFFTSSKSIMKIPSLQDERLPKNKNKLNLDGFFSIILKNKLNVDSNKIAKKRSLDEVKYNKIIIKDRGDSWLMYFSSSRDHILHVMTEEIDFEYKLSEEFRIPSFFKKPQILKSGFDGEKYFVKEEYIHQDNNDINVNIINKLLDIYSNYYKSANNPKSYFQFQHGDLFRDNLIQRDDELYFIDWDWQGFYPFYYDILFLIVYEHLFNKSQLLHDFMAGKFDHGFLKLSKSCGQTYYPHNKNKYIYNVLSYRQNIRKDNVRQFKDLQEYYK